MWWCWMRRVGLAMLLLLFVVALPIAQPRA
jgi:hypothetical protein